MPKFRLQVAALLVVTSLFLAGCGQQETTSYSVPKDSPAAPPTTPPPPQAPAASGPIQWTTPAGWEEQPPSGMRAGSFLVRKGDQRADVSIIPLAGISGSELDNVNRWRGQVQLEPVDAAKLAEMAEAVPIGSTSGSVYDMVGVDPQTKQPTRILASILATGATTWFFKMTGPAELVLEQKPAFKELLKSVRIQEGVQQMQSVDPVAEAHRSMGEEMKDFAAVPGHGSTAADKPAWEVPTGWQEQAPTSMRAATFLIQGENGAKAEVSVIKLSGVTGGTLANVNRWRAQVGLEPVDEAELEKLVTTREVNGTKIILADMAGRNIESGDSARLLAGIVPRSASTWFYKLLGDDALVAQQKPVFIKFIETARYPNAS